MNRITAWEIKRKNNYLVASCYGKQLPGQYGNRIDGWSIIIHSAIDRYGCKWIESHTYDTKCPKCDAIGTKCESIIFCEYSSESSTSYFTINRTIET